MNIFLRFEVWARHKINRCFPICPHCINAADDIGEALRQGFENLAEAHSDDHQIRFLAKSAAAEFADTQREQE